MEAEGPGVAAAAPAQAAQAPEGAGGATAEPQTDAHAGGEPQPQAVSGGGKHGLGAWPPPRMGAPAGCHTLIGGMSLPSAVPQLSRRMPAAHLCRRCRRCRRLQAPEAAADGQPPPQGQQQQHAFNPNKKRKVALFMAYVGHGYQVWFPMKNRKLLLAATAAAPVPVGGATAHLPASPCCSSCAALSACPTMHVVFLAAAAVLQGMQRNPGAKSIEDELFKALHAAGAISDANADEHGYMKVGCLKRISSSQLQADAVAGLICRFAPPAAFSTTTATTHLRFFPPWLQLHWMRAARTDKGVSAVGQVRCAAAGCGGPQCT